MTPSLKMTAAGLVLAAVMAACSPPAEKAAEAVPAVAATADTQPFRIGQLQAVALKDGDIVLENSAAGGSPWADTAGVAELLGTTGDGKIHLSIQPLLVRDGERTVLIDTGAGGAMGTANKLPTSLRSAGVQPGQVTDILISHGHGDHLGGLVANGALVFPNATIRMSEPEWRAVKADPEVAALVPVITPKVQTFAFGAQVTPSITAVALDGHTAGHTGYEIASGDDRLLYFGDALHSSVISVQRPEFVNAWDFNSDAAIATRQNLLERAATQSLRVYGVHFPFPGLGRIQRQDDGFVWTPDASAAP
ncbi:MAG: MBL fold metallo-hydrolase [Brevundimonas sp.]|nr:MAG: MBL fold metallo-hydrolase [Brevundimonas sp.]